MGVQDQWRKVRSFPGYEVNILQEVREAKTQKPVNPTDAARQMFMLQKDGISWGVSIMTLVKEAFPEFYPKKEL